jgi:hypothetical protein
VEAVREHDKLGFELCFNANNNIASFHPFIFHTRLAYWIWGDNSLMFKASEIHPVVTYPNTVVELRNDVVAILARRDRK